jgi:carboxyl-terminal processing protease
MISKKVIVFISLFISLNSCSNNIQSYQEVEKYQSQNISPSLNTFNHNQPILSLASNLSIKPIKTFSDSSEISTEAKNYIDIIIQHMETGFIRKNEIDWSFLKDEVYKSIKGAKTTNDTYIGVVKAINILNEKHTVFYTPDGQFLGISKLRSNFSPVKNMTQIPENFGYLKKPGFSGNKEQSKAFANDIRNSIISQDKKPLNGWVIDLRENGGGNMWPMLIGLYPILGQENQGYFKDSNNNIEPWNKIIEVFNKDFNLKKYTLKNNNPKIAVLFDETVASSGEATAIAFAGRRNTKSFGQPTAGYATANNTLPLSDGAKLILTSAYMLDRTKKIYSENVIPDIIVQNNSDTLKVAIEWLQM